MDLKKHEGHRLQIVQYGSVLELECLTCRETLAEQRADRANKTTADAPAACDLGEGCATCSA